MLAAAAGASACAGLQPRSAGTAAQTLKPVAPAPIPPPAAITAPANAPPNSYANSQYKFTCTIPDGFIVSHESEGPGEIMTLAPQSVSSNSTANISVRAARLGRLSLDQYMELRVTRDLQGTANVAHWDKFPASYGVYSGTEVVVERQYASGPFKSRIFGFSHGPDVFIVNYTASSDQFDSGQKVLDQFLGTLSFTP